MERNAQIRLAALATIQFLKGIVPYNMENREENLPIGNSTKNTREIADSLAQEVCATIGADPLNVELVRQSLQDLKLKTARAAANLTNALPPDSRTAADLVIRLASVLPDYEFAGLYEKRSSITSIAGAVLFGWFIGGLAATLLNLIGLGGEIIRALAIFAAIWFNEYMSANPRARKIILTCLGLGALARFTAALASGIVRLGSFASFRQLIFGAARPNIFKSAWLIFGALFFYVFFSKKIIGADLASFEQNLRDQIEQRLELAGYVLGETGNRDLAIQRLKYELDKTASGDACPKNSCQLAQAVLDILDTLDDGKKAFLAEKLATMGFSPKMAQNGTFIWNDDRDYEQYIPIGLVSNGDLCHILKMPHMAGGKLVKGHAQRIINS